MNWFERYGIVGAYFLTVLSVFLKINQYFAQVDFGKDGAVIIAFFSFSALPAGYILSIFSQLLYYCGFGGTQIHKETVKYLPEKLKNELNLLDSDNEQKLEAKITAKIRLSAEHQQLQYLGVFATKRWDVLAVNSAIRLATVVLIILYFPIKFYKSKIFCFSFGEIGILLSGLILILILDRSSQILSMQIIEINKTVVSK